MSALPMPDASLASYFLTSLVFTLHIQSLAKTQFDRLWSRVLQSRDTLYGTPDINRDIVTKRALHYIIGERISRTRTKLRFALARSRKLTRRLITKNGVTVQKSRSAWSCVAAHPALHHVTSRYRGDATPVALDPT